MMSLHPTIKSLLFLSAFNLILCCAEIELIPRRVPPKGVELSVQEKTDLLAKLNELENLLKKITHPLKADAELYHKAVEFALENDEFYAKKDNFEIAAKNIELGKERALQLLQGKAPWTTQTGMVARGYRSTIDGSVLPFLLEVPEGLDLSKPVQLWVWLHGRGEKSTDLHFINGVEKSKRKLPTVQNGIVLHPFGRQCIGWKSAGEFDILHAIDYVKTQFNIDDNRIALLGFSMGGAGAWQAGAHFTEKWVALHAGAGFSETAEFLGLKKSDYPPWYEQKLWGIYDIPNYVRNLFNIPVISYSGEIDKQMQAARVMERNYSKFGKTLPHLIGPKMGHKYAEGYLEQVVDYIEKAMVTGRNTTPSELTFQTQTLRYPSMHWVKAQRLDEHFVDSRIDAKLVSEQKIQLLTQNISEFSITSPLPNKAPFKQGFSLEIDGQSLSAPETVPQLNFVKDNGKWSSVASFSNQLKKVPGLQGPMDDAFNEPFLVVFPSGKSSHPKIQQWLDFEFQHLKERWAQVFRGRLPTILDSELTPAHIENYHLIVWGDPDSNLILKQTLAQLPLQWKQDKINLHGESYDSSHHLPLLCYPNPLNPKKYLVLNTGPTFREDDDANNSKQNSRLPDWAVIDIDTPPNKFVAGKVCNANFFDEFWQLKK